MLKSQGKRRSNLLRILAVLWMVSMAGLWLAHEQALAADELEFDFKIEYDFGTAIDLAVDSEGHIYVSRFESGDESILIFDAEGNYVKEIHDYDYIDPVYEQTMTDRSFTPYGIAIDGADRLYVVDELMQYIIVFDSDGSYVDHWGGAGTDPGEFTDASDVAVDRDGNIYVLDAGNDRVQVFESYDDTDPDIWNVGSFTGIAIDANNHVYLVDQAGHRVLKYASDGIKIGEWGSYGAEMEQDEGEFNSPNNVAVDPNGDVYVTDFALLQKFDHEGGFLGRWGEAEAIGSDADGEFKRASGVAVNEAGVVYVLDRTNDRIQVFKPVPSDADLSEISLSAGALEPDFHPNTTEYSIQLPNEVSEITVTAATYDEAASLTINGELVVSGAASDMIELEAGVEKEIVLEVTGASGKIKVYTIEVTRALSSLALLRELSVEGHPLDPSFDPAITEYEIPVDYDTRTVTVTADVYDDQTMKLDMHTIDMPTGSGTYEFHLDVGHNPLVMTVQAEDGTQRQYTVDVIRKDSGSANLYGLLLFASPPGPSLTPTFDPDTTTYAVRVANSTDTVTVKATVEDGAAVGTTGATVTVNGESTPDNTESEDIALAIGENTITIVVTSADSSATKTYKIDVYRANANLSQLDLSAGDLSPATVDPDVTEYTATVGYETDKIAVTPLSADEEAVVTVNGGSVTRGDSSVALDLEVGANTIEVVIAVDGGAVTRTYNVVVMREPSDNRYLRSLDWSGGTEFTPAFDRDTFLYTSTVPHEVSSVTVTPTLDNQDATATVNGLAVDDGDASSSIELDYGMNDIDIVVTAQNGDTNTYQLKVMRRLMEGDGTEESPYVISTRAELERMRLELNAYYTLAADINLSDAPWVPIAGAFAGSFDGRGHTLKNLTIEAEGQDKVGFFTEIAGATEATIRNVSFRHAEVAGGSNVGILAGMAGNAVLEQIEFLHSSVSGDSVLGNVGALAGYASDAQMTKVYSKGTVVHGKGSTGGLIGFGSGILLTNSFFTGEVDGGDGDGEGVNVGGLVGLLMPYMDMTPSPLEDVYSHATVTGVENVGGLVGSWMMPHLLHTYAAGETRGGSLVGGLVGNPMITATVTSSYYLERDGISVDNGFGVGLSEEDFSVKNTFTGWDFDGTWSMVPGPYPRLIASLSTNTDLADLETSIGGLVPTFDASVTSYTLTVTNAVYEVTLTPTAAEGTSVIEVEGVRVESGEATVPIPLAVGSNVVELVVTAEAGQQKTYTVDIIRLKSDEARLGTLEISQGVLEPVFDPNETAYLVTVANAVDSFTLTPTVIDADASLTIEGEVAVSGATSDSIPLTVGENSIEIEVTAANDDVLQYVIVVVREPSDETKLANLSLSTGALSPTFDPTITEYTVALPYADSSIRITPSLADPSAAVTVDGVNVLEGHPSPPIMLEVGLNPIHVEVTAQDGITTQVYTIHVTRAAAPVPSTEDEGEEDDVDEEEAPEQGQGVTVRINGKPQPSYIMTTRTQADGHHAVAVSFDEAQQSWLEDVEPSSVITIEAEQATDELTAGLTGQMVKQLENKQASVALVVDGTTYSLPAEALGIDQVATNFGEGVRLEDIVLDIQVSRPAAMDQQLQEQAASGGYEHLVAPMRFMVTATHKVTSLEVDRFGSFVQRTFSMPDGADPSRITTGVIVLEDGSVHHVPTRILETDGLWTAEINSLTNSTYSVIWHPVAAPDMKGHWAEAVVNDLASRMVVEGDAQGRFHPDQEITRAEFAAIVIRGLGIMPTGTPPAYTDVNETDWFANVVQTASMYELIQGYHDGTFRPHDPITREQATVIMVRALEMARMEVVNAEAADELAAYEDRELVSDWARAEMVHALRTGIVSGRGEATLAPQASITRAEAAVLLHRLLVTAQWINAVR